MDQQVSYLMSQQRAKIVYSVKCPVTLKASILDISADSGNVWMRSTVNVCNSEMEKASRKW